MVRNFVSFHRHKLIVANEKGVTLIELLIVLALLGIVIGGAYQYFFYGYNSWVRSAAETEMIQNARQTVIHMETDVREAESAAEGMPPVVVLDSGRTLRIYTRSHNETHPKLVSYRLNDGNLERGVSLPENEEYPYQYKLPAQWETVVSNVVNDVNDEIFTVIDGGTEGYQRIIINVDLHIISNDVRKPFNIQAVLTVRQGVI